MFFILNCVFTHNFTFFLDLRPDSYNLITVLVASGNIFMAHEYVTKKGSHRICETTKIRISPYKLNRVFIVYSQNLRRSAR